MNKTKPAESAAAPPPGQPAHRAHSLNTITLEVNAGKDIVDRSTPERQWATVFAIHNKYAGKTRPPKSIPMSISFGPSTVSYALAGIRRGTHFTVTGELDFTPGTDGKDFYGIEAFQLRIHTPAAKTAADQT